MKHLFTHSTKNTTYQRSSLSLSIGLGVAGAFLLSACNDNIDSSAHITSGDLLTQSTVATKTTAQLKTAYSTLSPVSANLAGEPTCDVQVERIRFATKGSKGEYAESTAAMLVPTGTDPSCSGSRPLLLHAHGTAVEKSYDFSQVGSSSNEAGWRSAMMAATYAAQGYIVIAPNYVGYGGSSLDYSTYLNAEQQSHEMKDALTAGRDAIRKLAHVKDNGKLFITGYSQGGHVALATAKTLQQNSMTVTAVAPMSGPYAMAAFGDAIFYGSVNGGGTIFGPLLTESYQTAYGNIYTKPSELYAGKYANTIPNLLPGTQTFEQLLNGTVPASAIFQKAPTGIAALDPISPASPTFGHGFSDDNYLMTSSYRAAYLADAQKNPDGLLPNRLPAPFPSTSTQHPLRQALVKNDLRSYSKPSMPVLLCGGNQDPVVFYDLNAGVMAGLFKHTAAKYVKLDVDTTNAKDRATATTYETAGLATSVATSFENQAKGLQAKFTADVAAIGKAAGEKAAAEAMAAGKTAAEAQAAAQQVARLAVAQKYHGIVAPYCASTAKDFFANF